MSVSSASNPGLQTTIKYDIKILYKNNTMEHVYILIYGSDWEDVIVFLSLEDAIKESKRRPDSRIEFFSKTDTPGYHPTNNCYTPLKNT
jgi:hypothetical protein